MGVDYVNEPEGNIDIIFMNKTQKDKNLGGWRWKIGCSLYLALPPFFPVMHCIFQSSIWVDTKSDLFNNSAQMLHCGLPSPFNFKEFSL